MLAGKIFGCNEELVAETEAYFEAKPKEYYQNGIKKLEGRGLISQPVNLTIAYFKQKKYKKTILKNSFVFR